MTNSKYRAIDGSDNNSDKGKAHNQLIRLFAPAFKDGISVPRGGEFNDSNLPNPRTISNIVIDQTESVTNFLNASDWLWQWGQVLDHDFALNEAEGEVPPQDFTPIAIPDGDPTFADGTQLPFIRVTAAEGTGGGETPRQINNQITAYIDGSLVYGSDEERASFLRDFDSGKGLLKTSLADNGEVLLPLNPVGTPDQQSNADGGGVLRDFQFVAGDVRVNEQSGLTAAHNLLVREHNRLALELNERLKAGETELTNEFDEFADEFLSENPDSCRTEAKDEFLYESSRKVIAAKIQVISYQEFLPLLIGETLEPYKGFDSTINPQITVEFANAAFRLGHTLLSNQIRRVDSNGVTETSLVDNFFNPQDIQEKGIDTLLTGLIFQGAQEVDHQLVDGVREFLFPAGTGGLDLGTVNIARGRETGVPSYTTVYEELFDTKITSFDDLKTLGLFSSPVVDLFATAYDNVEQIDLWLGGISEQPGEHGGLLGPTFSSLIADQFMRSRDGDEFFYLNDLEHLNILDPDIEDTTLSELIRNNVADPYLISDDAFKVPYENSIFGDDTKNILKGKDLNDLIDGREKNDIIKGRGGNDILFGGLGDDYIRGGSGADKIMGGDGHDKLKGNSGSDYINGGLGDDYIRGGRGDDAIRGGAGNDLIFSGDGEDTYVFGTELFDGIGDVDIIYGFRSIDSFDFESYLEAGGTIDYQLIGRKGLQIDLNDEDVVNVFGSRNAIDNAVAQLDHLMLSEHNYHL
ncbi:MAG: peroxidase family protein [Waterburya sp.]